MIQRGIALFVLETLAVICQAQHDPNCKPVPKSDREWNEIDMQYAKLERAMLDRDAKALFALYAPDFEAHMLNGQVWKFSQSAAYSTAGLEHVKKNINLSNTIIGMESCSPDSAKATVIQQWARMQVSFGKLRKYETTTVQDETWVLNAEGWKRKLVENVRPGAWYVDEKRVDPTKPYTPDAPPFDPHALLAGSSQVSSSHKDR